MTSLIDYSAWLFLQWYFLPFRMPALMGETDKWVSSVSLNGVKTFTMCPTK